MLLPQEVHRRRPLLRLARRRQAGEEGEARAEAVTALTVSPRAASRGVLATNAARLACSRRSRVQYRRGPKGWPLSDPDMEVTMRRILPWLLVLVLPPGLAA